MGKDFSRKTIHESERETKVYDSADVAVVGGGPAGVASAIASARSGAKTILMERYGHLGGMATGGLVLFYPYLSDATGEQQIAGIAQEILDRLDVRGAALHPRKHELGSSREDLVRYWMEYHGVTVDGHVRLSAYVDPEILKCVLNDMIEEAGVELLLHSWGADAIVENNEVQGIIFQSKSGRKAVLGKVIVDTTGDGDIFASAGAEFDGTLDPKLRSASLALVFRVGNIDHWRFRTFKIFETERYAELMKELTNMGGFHSYFPTHREDQLWFNNWLVGFSSLKVGDLTRVEVDTRKRMLITFDFFKKNVPGFEKSFILDTASQLGTRGSRRLIGEYIVTADDMAKGILHEDTIAIIPRSAGYTSKDQPLRYIPYRALVPRRLENLLVAGRCFSSDVVANDTLNLITHCVVMGQAAGTAAALAVSKNVKPRKIDHKLLQAHLIRQGVVLPDMAAGKVKKGS